MRSEFEIAKILKPRGLKGEMKVEFYSSDVARFSHLKEVRISGAVRKVTKIVCEGDFGFIQLADVNDVDGAEKLRGQMVYASREALPPLDEDKHYIVDMIGMSVFVGADRIGTLSDIQQFGSADVYTVKTDSGTLSFPALKQLIVSVDVKGGKLVLDGTVFSRVVVYN